MTFFILSLNLADWIARDEDDDISQDEINREMGGSHIMSVANDFANPSNHFGRDEGRRDDIKPVTK